MSDKDIFWSILVDDKTVTNRQYTYDVVLTGGSIGNSTTSEN